MAHFDYDEWKAKLAEAKICAIWVLKFLLCGLFFIPLVVLIDAAFKSHYVFFPKVWISAIQGAVLMHTGAMPFMEWPVKINALSIFAGNTATAYVCWMSDTELLSYTIDPAPAGFLLVVSVALLLQSLPALETNTEIVDGIIIPVRDVFAAVPSKLTVLSTFLQKKLSELDVIVSSKVDSTWKFICDTASSSWSWFKSAKNAFLDWVIRGLNAAKRINGLRGPCLTLRSVAYYFRYASKSERDREQNRKKLSGALRQ